MLLITREIQNTIIMAKSLSKYKIDFFSEPMLIKKNIPYKNHYSIDKENSSILIITSFNAISHINNKDLQKLIRHVKSTITLTELSKQNIEHLGFRNVINVNGNVNTLIEYIKNNICINEQLLYIRGEHISCDIKYILIKYGFNNIIENISYKMNAVTQLSTNCLNMFRSQAITSILLLSNRTSRILFNLANQYQIMEYISKCIIITNSNKVAKYIETEEIMVKKVHIFKSNDLYHTLKSISNILVD